MLFLDVDNGVGGGGVVAPSGKGSIGAKEWLRKDESREVILFGKQKREVGAGCR